MHNSSLDKERTKTRDELLLTVTSLVTEGRIPEKLSNKSKGFYEGPHICLNNKTKIHKCESTNKLCSNYENLKHQIVNSQRNTLTIDVFLSCLCEEDTKNSTNFLLEKWYITVERKRNSDTVLFSFVQLLNAIRSQLYFSQLTAWLTIQDDKSDMQITTDNLRYNIITNGYETYRSSTFNLVANRHNFPLSDIGNSHTLNVVLLSAPRKTNLPKIVCARCANKSARTRDNKENDLLDDRMHIICTMKGKHRCEDFDDVDTRNKHNNIVNNKRLCQMNCTSTEASTSYTNYLQKPKLNVDIEKAKQWKYEQNKGQTLLDAIERSGQKNRLNSTKIECDYSVCDKSVSDKISIREQSGMMQCDSPKLKKIQLLQACARSNRCPQRKVTFDDTNDKSNSNAIAKEFPTALEQAKFRKELDNAASMVFHSRSGLPLTSSPAPVRRGKSCFDFDSTINSVSAIKSALFSNNFSVDDDSESDCSLVSPCSPDITTVQKKEEEPIKYRKRGHAANLLGSFEESVLNGRLEPNSTVHGFTAELGASGSFVPKHLVLPVTVFFFTLGDNDQVSSPYLGHINLGRKGYNVPKAGTVQVTLFNPLGTVVKMFVIIYDLNDMPANSQTFLRQRTLYMPTNCQDEAVEWGPKWLRYLIHLRFISSKSGKIYLHSDIRMIIFRKSDLDTATAHGIDTSYELRSFTHMPNNPRYSSRK